MLCSALEAPGADASRAALGSRPSATPSPGLLPPKAARLFGGLVEVETGKVPTLSIAGRTWPRRDAAFIAGLMAQRVPFIVAELQASGATTTRALAAALNARGIRTTRAGAWHTQRCGTCWRGGWRINTSALEG